MHVISQAFTGIWIPREVALDKDLTPMAKMLYGVIQALDGGESGCYASNAYLAEVVGCNKRHVQGMIKTLIEKDLLVSRTIGEKATETRSLTTASTLAFQKTPRAPQCMPPVHSSAP